jgi:predicted patatin/cPLA2 family phospholipase
MTVSNVLLTLLISRLKEKKKLLEANNPKHKEIKTALIVDGGGMKGVYAAGVIAALKKLGFENVFDLVIAVSSGTIAASYFLSGQGNIAPAVFYEGLASKKFIDVYKFHPAKIVGVDYGNSVFLKEKPLRQTIIRKSRSQFYIGVTNPDTGKAEYLAMKDETIDVVDAMNASSAIPVIHNKMVKIHGQQYLDGMISCGIPIEPVLENNYTDILVIENMPLGQPGLWPSMIINSFLSVFKFQIKPETKRAILEKNNRYHDTLQKIYEAQNTNVHIGIIAPSEQTVGTFSINSKLLQQTAEEAKEQTLKIFSNS